MTMINEPIIISSPHLHQATSVGRVMRQVIYALVPGILLSIWAYGIAVLFQCVLAIIFALLLEALMLRLRNRPLRLYLGDGSAVVTALLFAMCISPYVPVWVNFLGIAFAIVVVKHLYGGVGYNLFNPAMAGYVFVLLCFPAAMTFWPLPPGAGAQHASLSETLSIIFTGSSSISHFDALSGASALSYMKSQLSGMAMMSEVRMSPLFGSLAGRGSEWIALAWMGGGLWLIMQRIIKWQLPLMFLATLFVTSLLFYWVDNNIYPSPLLTLFAGGSMLAAFFIITDPVTASATPRGKMIYAVGIAFLAYLIRTFGAYPDGITFAVLIMNAAVPLIDNYTRPPAFGEKQHG